MVRFKRYAGSLQLELATFDDVQTALTVPKTQWVATACPIAALNCDDGFLAFLDSDSNGRVRVEEFTRAVEWTAKMLDDTSDCDRSAERLDFAKLSKDGAHLRDAALLVLEAEGDEKREGITLDQVRTSDEALRKAYFNGDGIVSRESITDPRLGDVVKLLLETTVGATSRSGTIGITREQLDEVRKRITAAREHHGTRTGTFSWGDDSATRAQAVYTARAKVDEYFLQCRLVAAQPGASARLHVPEDAIGASVGDVAALERVAGSAPIAPPDPSGALSWASLFRGAHIETLTALRTLVFEPTYGVRDRMTEAEWRALVLRAEAIVAWRDVAERDKSVYEHYDALIGVTDEEFATLEKHIEADLARKERLEAVSQLEKLILFQRWLLRFANNFVSMPELYDPGRTALFERGRMILSGRLFAFSVLVADRAAHAALAVRGTTYIAYVRVSARDGGAGTFEVAIPVTYGTAAGVEVGKRGIFIDTNGIEWDATVMQVITNPVSLWEAIIAPYRRIGTFVSSKVEAWAGQGDRELEQQLNRGHEHVQQATAGVTTPATAVPATPTPASPTGATSPGAGMNGNVAIALSIAISAISASIAAIAGVFNGKSVLQILGMLVGLFMAVSVPAGAFAWLKLRRRDMAIMLEACGWALNDRMRLGRYLGALFTRRPARPKDSKVETLDSVRETIDRRRAEGIDETEANGLRWWMWLLIGLAGVFILAFVWRIELCGLGANRGWVQPSVCNVIARSHAVPAPAATVGDAGVH